jgi:hypothetical protein
VLPPACSAAHKVSAMSLRPGDRLRDNASGLEIMLTRPAAGLIAYDGRALVAVRTVHSRPGACRPS